MVAAVVPVKTLARAKERLSGLLSPGERRRLCLAMLCDVLDALQANPDVSEIHVVTADADVPGLLGSRYPGVRFIREPARGRGGLNPALRHAARRLEALGVKRMLVVPADLPLLGPKALGGVIRSSRDVSVAIVPDRNRRGTSLLLLSPPSAIPPRFGGNSFARHREEARRKSLRFSILPGGHSTWDVDCPADLVAVLRHGRGTKTRAEACETGIDRRLPVARARAPSRRMRKPTGPDAATRAAGTR